MMRNTLSRLSTKVGAFRIRKISGGKKLPAAKKKAQAKLAGAFPSVKLIYKNK
jgi:hypothetical protein